MISPTQISLLDNTQHSQEIYNHAPGGIQATVPASERAQTHAVARAITRFGGKKKRQPNVTVKSSRSHRLPRAQVGSSVYSKTYTYMQRHCWNGWNIILIQQNRVVRNVIDSAFVRIWLLEQTCVIALASRTRDLRCHWPSAYWKQMTLVCTANDINTECASYGGWCQKLGWHYCAMLDSLHYMEWDIEKAKRRFKLLTSFGVEW